MLILSGRRRGGATPGVGSPNRLRPPNRATPLGQPPGWLRTALTARKETNQHFPAFAADIFSRGDLISGQASAINTHQP